MGKGHGDGLYVNYGSLEAVADDIKKQADQLKEDLGDIQTAVSKVASVWEGDAKTAYHEVQHKWNTMADEVHSTLMVVVSKVKVASGDYNATDKKAAQQFQS